MGGRFTWSADFPSRLSPLLGVALVSMLAGPLLSGIGCGQFERTDQIDAGVDQRAGDGAQDGLGDGPDDGSDDGSDDGGDDAPWEGPDGGTDAPGDPAPDGAVTPGDAGDCVPESDQTFCQRLEAGLCGPAQGLDNCGQIRSVAQCETCPFSSCSGPGVCAPVCNVTGFERTPTSLPVVNGSGTKNHLVSTSLTGDSVVHVRDPNCNFNDGYYLHLSDRVGQTVIRQDISQLPVLASLRKMRSEGHDTFVALTPDGKGLVGVPEDGRSFKLWTRSALGQIDFVEATSHPFGTINSHLANLPSHVTVSNPLLSGDGLGFYYSLNENPPNGDALSRVYESSRSSITEDFSVGRTMYEFFGFDILTGISPDRLTGFVLYWMPEKNGLVTAGYTRAHPSHTFPGMPDYTFDGMRGTVGAQCQVWAHWGTTCLDDAIYPYTPLTSP